MGERFKKFSGLLAEHAAEEDRYQDFADDMMPQIVRGLQNAGLATSDKNIDALMRAVYNYTGSVPAGESLGMDDAIQNLAQQVLRGKAN